jgi:hypothetical protein
MVAPAIMGVLAEIAYRRFIKYCNRHHLKLSETGGTGTLFMELVWTLLGTSIPIVSLWNRNESAVVLVIKALSSLFEISVLQGCYFKV